MLGFFRRIINSRVGIIVTFVVLGVIALAFAAGDVTGLRSGGGGPMTGDWVARVGRTTIGPAEFQNRVQTEMEGFRQQQPTLDLATFVAQGGFDGTLQRMETSLAYQAFADRTGMAVSKRTIDGHIASIPALQGASGQFDEQLYRRVLQQRKLTDAQVRGDILRDTLGNLIVAPGLAATQVPVQIAIPYASLLLERRTGQVAVVPIAAMPAGAAPTDAELQTFYQRGIARYTLPERRVARYALVSAEQVRAASQPTEADIAAAYNADRAKYAATEKRDVTQVVVADQAGATALAARVRGGASIADAARAAGLEASTQTGVEKAAYAAASSPDLANAVFGAAQGTLVGPIRGPLGFVVARVDKVEQVAARPLASVRDEIAKTLATQKATEALGTLRDQIDDALAGNATFDEVVGDRKLAARTTPALTAAGTDPTSPAARPDPALAPIVTAAFASGEGDPPQIVATGQDGSFAVVALGRTIPAAPRPLAEVRAAVTADFVADRKRQAARRIAAQVVAKVNGGATLAQALAGAGVSLPAPQPLAAARQDFARAPESARAPLQLLFALQPSKARFAPAADGSALAIVRLDRIDRTDAARVPQAVKGTQASFGQLVGREYAEQLVRAVRQQVGVEQNAATIQRIRGEMLGRAAGSGGTGDN